MAHPDGHISFYPDATTVRHYKGGHYVVICHASHSETGEGLVVYKSKEAGMTWVRPVAMFYDWIDADTPRFTKVEV